MGKFLVWLSGANKQILDGSPTDHAKYVGIGTLILIPGIMGAVSMMFALTTVLNFEVLVALPFAVAWGLAIICMDRVFVVTLQRKRSWLAIPRIVLALLLGLVISTPFILQIFRPEIEQQIVKIQNQQATAFIGSNASNSVAAQITKDKATIATLQQDISSGGGGPDFSTDATIKSLNAQLGADQGNETKWYDQWQCQLYGTSQGPGGGKCKKGNGVLAQHSESEYNYYLGQVAKDQAAITARESVLKNSFQSTQTKTVQQEEQQLTAAQAQLQTDQTLQANETANFLGRNKEDTGLLIRLKALDEVTAGNPTLEEARWLLFALFVAIDLMPVMVKVLMNWAAPSSYEKLLSGEEETQLEVAENKRAVWKHTQFRAAQTMIGSSKDRLAGLNAPLPEVKDNIIAARRRVEGEWLRAWEDEQMRRVANGQQITPSQTGVGPEKAASPAAWSPPARQPAGSPAGSWWQDLRERFSQRSEPADPRSAPSRRSARRRARAAAAAGLSDGLFQRRVPGNATAGDTRPSRMFLREYIPRSAPSASGPPSTDPNGPAQGSPYVGGSL
jgi:hypothetical protein